MCYKDYLNSKNLTYEYDKEKMVDDYINYMFNRTQEIFDYVNLPETINERDLEFQLQINGNCFFYKTGDSLYTFTGGLGGEPNVYYEPTIYTIANPALNLNVNAKIDVDGVLMRNDSCMIGLLPMFKKYADMLSEIDITQRITAINMRMPSLISASDDNAKAAAEKYLNDIAIGKLGVISDNAFLEGIKTMEYTGRSYDFVMSTLYLRQYLLGTWFHEVGLNATFMMKTSYVNKAEGSLDQDVLYPLIDNMLKERQMSLEKVNKMFNTNIEVELSSTWLDNKNPHDDIGNPINRKIDEGDEDDEQLRKEKIEGNNTD